MSIGTGMIKQYCGDEKTLMCMTRATSGFCERRGAICCRTPALLRPEWGCQQRCISVAQSCHFKLRQVNLATGRHSIYKHRPLQRDHLELRAGNTKDIRARHKDGTVTTVSPKSTMLQSPLTSSLNCGDFQTCLLTWSSFILFRLSQLRRIAEADRLVDTWCALYPWTYVKVRTHSDFRKPRLAPLSC